LSKNNKEHFEAIEDSLYIAVLEEKIVQNLNEVFCVIIFALGSLVI